MLHAWCAGRWGVRDDGVAGRRGGGAREGHGGHGDEHRHPNDRPPRHEAMVNARLEVLGRVHEQDHGHEHRVEGERDHIGREHPHAKEEDVEVRLVQRRQRALGDRLSRGGPQLHRAARPSTLLLAVRLVVGGDLIGALDVVPPHKVPTLEKGAQAEVHVLDERARIPPARRVDASLAPHSAGAVEV